jgi:hypothetical protein
MSVWIPDHFEVKERPNTGAGCFMAAFKGNSKVYATNLG